MRRNSLFILVCGALISCAVALHAGVQPTIEEAREALRLRSVAFSAAVVRASASGWEASEVATLVDFYTEDAVLFPPKGEPIRGREVVRSYWSRTPDRKILEHLIETERADIDGRLAVDFGKFTNSSQSGTSPIQRGTSNFISVWRRGDDGLWRKQLDSWW